MMTAEQKYQMLREQVEAIVAYAERTLEETGEHEDERSQGRHEVAFEVYMKLGEAIDGIDNIEELGLRSFPVSNLYPHPESV